MKNKIPNIYIIKALCLLNERIYPVVVLISTGITLIKGGISLLKTVSIYVAVPVLSILTVQL